MSQDRQQTESPASPWYEPRRWLVTAVAILVVSIGNQISAPGVSIDPTAAYGPLAVSVVLPVMSGVAWLIPFRALRAWIASDEPWVSHAAAAGFLVANAVLGWTSAAALELMSLEGLGIYVEAGMQFRLLTAMSFTAGGAIAWRLADWVSERGIGSGPLVLFAGLALPAALSEAFAAGGLASDLGLWPLRSVLLGVALSAMCALLAWRSPSWPAQMRSFPVRSPVDLLVLPLFVEQLAASFVQMGAVRIAIALAPLGAVAVVANWLRKQDGEARSVWAFAALIPLPALIISAFLGFFVAGGLARAFQPGPYDGDLDLHVQASCPGLAATDVGILQARFAALAVDAGVQQVNEGVSIELRGVSRVQDLMKVALPPYQLGFHEVVTTPTSTSTTVQDCSMGACQPLHIEPPLLDNRHIADAQFGADRMGAPMVMLTFTDEGTQRFGDATTDLIGERFAIAIDGRPLSVPTIREPITGGRAQISMGYGSADPEAEARALAAALSQQPLQGRCVVQTMDEMP